MHSTRRENPILPNSQKGPNFFLAWLKAARPQTWIASIAPVVIGMALAKVGGRTDPLLFWLTLFFALFIQIGTNFANDAFDFLNGADTKARQGPQRAVSQGWISTSTMMKAAVGTFALALLAAIPLMQKAGWWSIPLAFCAVLFGILYTGGPKPLGYLGLGEILVFIFFGPVSVCGTYFLQTNSLPFPIWIASIAPGLLSCSILIANNLRDEITDRAANKNTLIVRFGKKFGQWEYVLTVCTAASIPPLLVLFCGAPTRLLTVSWIVASAVPLFRKVFSFKEPRELISVLKGSAIILFSYTLFFTLLI